MEANDLLTTGNITTIVVWIVNLILPYVASYGLDKDVLTSLIFTLLWFGFTVFSSANPNTFGFLGNQIKKCKVDFDNSDNDTFDDDDLIMNDEYTEEVNTTEEGC